jgi:hypothetical protein
MIAKVVLALIAMLAAFFIWGYVRLRRGRVQTAARLAALEVAEIPALRDEGLRVLEAKLGVRLAFDDAAASARALDEVAWRDVKLQLAFERPDHGWHYVLPMGALLGEHMVRHAGAAWRKRPGEPPHLEIPVPGGSAEAFPFDKVLRHVAAGDRGDVHAYLMAAGKVGSAAQAGEPHDRDADAAGGEH